MKRSLLFFGIGALTMLASCDSTPQGYVVNGEITSATEGTIYLKRVEDKSFSVIGITSQQHILVFPVISAEGGFLLSDRQRQNCQ